MTADDDSLDTINFTDVDGAEVQPKTVFDYWPMKNSPPRETQKTTMEWFEKLPKDKKYIFCELPVGCHMAKTPILMADGRCKNVEDIEVGDFVMGPDGFSRAVLKLHRGRQQAVRIWAERDWFYVNEGHILALMYEDHLSDPAIHQGKIFMTAGDFLNLPQRSQEKFRVYYAPAINFNDKVDDVALPVAPYVMGCLLGGALLPQDKLDIPWAYKTASIAQRRELLVGLLDTIGERMEGHWGGTWVTGYYFHR
jgi:hypothetical protein